MKIQNIKVTGLDNAVQVLHAQTTNDKMSDSNFGLYPNDESENLIEHHLLKYGINNPTEEEEIGAYIDAIPYQENDLLYYASIGPKDSAALLNNTRLLSLIRFSAEITAKPLLFERFDKWLGGKEILIHLPLLDQNNYEEESYYFEINYVDLLYLCSILKSTKDV